MKCVLLAALCMLSMGHMFCPVLNVLASYAVELLTATAISPQKSEKLRPANKTDHL